MNEIEILDKKIDNTLNRKALLDKFNSIRNFSLELCKPLVTEDYVVQSMADVSPTKWHLAHTSWFFETFILKESDKNYKSLHPQYAYLFNSYYIQAGKRFLRNQRGLITRPTVKQVFEYRNYIDENIKNFIEASPEEILNKFASVLEIGFNHEQQHQELMLTDIKHVFSINPLYPVYSEKENIDSEDISNLNWAEFNEGIYEIGNEGKSFSYDNEIPKHKEFINSFKLGSRLITNGEYLEFMEDNGYNKPEIWLSDGAAEAAANNWQAPLYWEKKDNGWHVFTLNGLKKLILSEPVCHVSYYEADAFARWAGYRLPTEAEWETASQQVQIKGNFVETRNFHPASLQIKNNGTQLQQMFGDVWEWTRSAYSPYPGYKTLPGALGEYNGKFMSNQMILRGGSCATSETHIRKTYRNFFPPNARWQFMGIRLAKDN